MFCPYLKTRDGAVHTTYFYAEVPPPTTEHFPVKLYLL